MRYADIYLKLLLPGASQEMRVTGAEGRLDLNLAVAVYRGVEAVYRGAGRVAQCFRNRRAQRKTYGQLSRLDDRLLRDIGLERDQIPALVEELANSHRGDPRPAIVSAAGSAGNSLKA